MPFSNPSETPLQNRRFLPLHWAALLLLCLAAFFVRLGAPTLFDLDEGLYVSCAKQMVRSGDYITPKINSRPLRDLTVTQVPFFEKPILVYWAGAGAMRLFGIHEGVARLPVALASLLETLLVAWVGMRWFGRRAGLAAGVLYCLCPMTVLDARQMTTDALLVLWISTMLFAFTEARNRAWAAPLFWTACALALLTKGIVGLLLPLLVISVSVIPDWESRVGWKLRLRPFRTWWPEVAALRPLYGLLLVAVLVAPWHLLIYHAAGIDTNGRTWFQEYIIRQHLGRFRGMDRVHNAPLPSYFVYFLFGFFPWACWSPASFRISDALTSLDRQRRRFLLIWFWTLFLFFTAGAAKLPTYIVPAYPAAALLVGRWFAALTSNPNPGGLRSLRRGAAGAFWAAALLLIAALMGPHFIPPSAAVAPAIIAVVQTITGTLALFSLIAWVLASRTGANPAPRVLAVSVVMMVVLFALVIGPAQVVADRYVQRPYQAAAAAANADARAGIPVVYYHIIPRRPSMNYYAEYSPVEQREDDPKLLVRLMQPGGSVDVVTTSRCRDKSLQPWATAHLLRVQSLYENQGWSVVRISISPPGPRRGNASKQ